MTAHVAFVDTDQKSHGKQSRAGQHDNENEDGNPPNVLPLGAATQLFCGVVRIVSQASASMKNANASQVAITAVEGRVSPRREKKTAAAASERDNDPVARVLSGNQIDNARHAWTAVNNIGSTTQVAFARTRSHKSSLFSSADAVLNFAIRDEQQAETTGAELNFEGAMDRLEAIVEQMESGKLPLEDLIVRYEEGMNLVKICQERLASAEQKIEIIARNSAGKADRERFRTCGRGEHRTM